MSKTTKAERDNARARLLEIVKPGDTLHTTCVSVAASGMSRRLNVHKLREQGSDYLTGYVATLCGYQWKDGSIVVRGGGMDMGKDVVYQLGRELWPDGIGCIGEKCQSNDHSNGDRDYTPHGNGMTPHIREVLIGADHWHKDSGYALRQRWLS